MSLSQLLAVFRRLPPWGADDPGPSGWQEYEDAARLVQRANPTELDHALAEFLNEAEGAGGAANESRLFLLSRFVFDLPSRDRVERRRVFKGWVNWPEPDPEGVVDLSWPIRFGPGGPSLLDINEGSDGPRYAAIEEYGYLRENFGWRDLSR